MGGEEIKRRLELPGRQPGEEFEEGLRATLLRDQLERSSPAGWASPPRKWSASSGAAPSRSRWSTCEVSAAPFRAEATATDEEVARPLRGVRRGATAFPSSASLAYLLVDAGRACARAWPVTDADLEAYYREHQEEFKEQEQVCASHVLVKVKAPPRRRRATPTKRPRPSARGLLDRRSRRAPTSPRWRARVSEDKGSAERGGDLGCFPRGAMVPAFENAAFGLEPGQTSELVKSDFGYHIIRVASRREEQVPPLPAVKERIRPAVAAEKTQKLLAEQVGAGAGRARGGARLEDAAKAIGATVATSPAFSLATPPEPLAVAGPRRPGLRARSRERRSGRPSR